MPGSLRTRFKKIREKAASQMMNDALYQAGLGHGAGLSTASYKLVILSLRASFVSACES